MPTLAAIGERKLLELIAKLLPQPFKHVLIGTGDDAAVLQTTPHTAQVLTTDMLIEDVDFKRCYASFKEIGHKASAVNISDLAAMGAKPRALLAALALSPNERVADVLALVKSLQQTGLSYGAPLIGGDLSATAGPLVISITAIGEIAATRAAILPRAQAQLGDIIAVSGPLGGSAAGFHLLQRLSNSPDLAKMPRAVALKQLQPSYPGLSLKDQQYLVRKHLQPTAAVKLGELLSKINLKQARQPPVHAVVDVSDGLFKDSLLLVPKTLGIELEISQIPLDRGVELVAKIHNLESYALAGAYGEDFTLLMAIASQEFAKIQRAAQNQQITLTAIGRVSKHPGLHLRSGGTDKNPLYLQKLPHLGFEHYR